MLGSQSLLKQTQNKFKPEGGDGGGSKVLEGLPL